MDTQYRSRILEKIKGYLEELDKNDFSHNSSHIFRVERLAKRIASEEGADLEIIEAASLLFDIARDLEDKGIVEDHATEGARVARKVLSEIGFPHDKIEAVCHAIYVHRRSKNRKPQTLEAKILQDADYLDAMGAVDVARVIASALQSKKYSKPIYKEGRDDDADPHYSAIHFLIYKLRHPKHQPENFHTKTGRKLAKERYKFMKEFVERFIDEWYGRR